MGPPLLNFFDPGAWDEDYGIYALRVPVLDINQRLSILRNLLSSGRLCRGTPGYLICSLLEMWPDDGTLVLALDYLQQIDAPGMGLWAPANWGPRDPRASVCRKPERADSRSGSLWLPLSAPWLHGESCVNEAAKTLFLEDDLVQRFMSLFRVGMSFARDLKWSLSGMRIECEMVQQRQGIHSNLTSAMHFDGMALRITKRSSRTYGRKFPKAPRRLNRVKGNRNLMVRLAELASPSGDEVLDLRKNDVRRPAGDHLRTRLLQIAHDK